jgi:hypothetical protein
MKMKTIKSFTSLGALALVLVSTWLSGCRKNEDFILEESLPINLGIRLSLENDEFSYNAFGSYCENDGALLIVVANNAALLATDLNPDELNSGDFVLYRVGVEDPEYALLYVYEVVENGNPTVYLLIGEPSTISDVVIEDDFMTGSFSGEFTSAGGEFDVAFELSFQCQLSEDPLLCE